ncbi:hypothetical protein WDV76_11140 [Xenorhabdus griffiniae]|uniref:hypothetical protein n=1 Tax=Xenorhabdus griffiniae TaxID=351672 RepID=UPI0030D41635
MANGIQVRVSFEPEEQLSDAQAVSFFKQVTQDLVETLLRLKAVVEKTEVAKRVSVVKPIAFTTGKKA